jgi:DNA-directed RNA polymerase subunit M/transcription elongation factor TFIIS
MWSVIVFSERCTLKKLDVKKEGVAVVKRQSVPETVAKMYNACPTDTLTTEQIHSYFTQLYPMTQVDNSIKEKHINDIQNHQAQHSHAGDPHLVYNASTSQSNALSNENSNTMQKFVTNSDPLASTPQLQSSERISANQNNSDYVIKGSVSQKITTAEAPSKEESCPRCGASLVLRTTKRGDFKGTQFYGCSNYPKCKYTKNLTSNK